MKPGRPPRLWNRRHLIAQDAASQASLTVEAGKPEDLAANPIEWMASVPPPPAEEIPEAAADWSAEATEASDSDQVGIIETSNLKTDSTPVAAVVGFCSNARATALSNGRADDRETHCAKRRGYGAFDSQAGLGRPGIRAFRPNQPNLSRKKPRRRRFLSSSIPW